MLYSISYRPTTALAQSTPLSETILRGATQVVGTGMQIYDQQRMREMYFQHMQQTAGAFRPALRHKA